MKTNTFLTSSALTSSRVDSAARPAIAPKPRLATVGLHLIGMALALILVAGCNSKNTNNGGTNTRTSDPSTTQTDSSNQSNTPTGDDNGHMGPGANGGGMMGEGRDTTRNGNHRKGMNGGHGHRGMMNR